jgi:5-methylcytosine-specific restriction enzyme subunit McrC
MSSRVELFEHETVRVGQALRVVGGGEAVLTEPVFDALVRYNDANGGSIFRIGHRRITTTQFVGYLEVGALAIEVLPKADRSAPHPSAGMWRAGLLDMLRVATGLRFEMPSPASQVAGRTTLLDLVAARFLAEVEGLVHAGLAKGYRVEEANGSTFRGRLVMPAHLRENQVRADRFYVRFATFDRDIVLNQILAEALRELAGLSLASRLAARVVACRALFPEVRSLTVTPSTFERIRLGRTTARYADALALARLILERRAPELRSGREPVFALLFDMNVLWERYVGALFRAEAGPLRVSTQESRGFWKVPTRPSRTIRPDIVVRRGDEAVLVADTKWKALADGPPADADLKQMFAYNELFGCKRALLVYPSVGAGSPLGGNYVGKAHGCETVHLGLAANGTWSRDALKTQVRALLERHHLRDDAIACAS